MKILAVMIAAVAIGACGARTPGPPEIQVDRTSCAHCSMLISEPRYAAAYQVTDMEARTFDDIGCLLKALSREANPPERVWFMDAANSSWIDGDKAVFVLSEGIRTPMLGGVTAYRDLTSAEDAAARHDGKIVKSFADLRAAKGVR